MKKEQGLATAAIFVLALTALVGMGPKQLPQPFMAEQAPPPASLGEDEFQTEAGDYYFKRTRDRNDWVMTYRFLGLAEQHELTCRINIQESQNLIDKFSYRNSEKASLVAKDLEEQLKKEAGSRGLLFYGEPRVANIFDSKADQALYRVEWIWRSEGFSNHGEDEDAKRKQEEFYAWYQREHKKLLFAAESRFMQGRGFLYDPQQGWSIDYSTLVATSTRVLKDCIDAFDTEIGGEPAVLMKFFQVMQYKFIGDKNTGWTTGGVRVPSSVMLQSEGDCDSKAASFCVLESKYPHSLVIFRSFRRLGDKTPGHALVGVEPYPMAEGWIDNRSLGRLSLEAIFYENPVQFANHYYVPCEVTSRGAEYGAVAIRPDEDGHIRYKDDYVVIPIRPLIPPPAAAAPRTRPRPPAGSRP